MIKGRGGSDLPLALSRRKEAKEKPHRRGEGEDSIAAGKKANTAKK